MKILNLRTGPCQTLAAKVTHACSRSTRPFLMYRAIKLGLEVVFSTKLRIWDRALAVQPGVQIAKLISASSHVPARSGGKDLEQQILSRLNMERDSATDAKPALPNRMYRGKARAARTVDHIHRSAQHPC